jgi:NAD+ kinase
MKIQNALIVYNKPLYQLLILEGRDPYYRKLIQARHHTTLHWKKVYQQQSESLEGVDRTLRLLGIATDRVYRKDLKKIGRYDLVITVGGDGTVLETSHFITDQILLGVNGVPMESVGALCHTRLETFLGTMIDLMTGAVKPIRVPRLRVRVGRKTLAPLALNEVLFANRSPAGTSRYWLQIKSRAKKQKEEQKSSGIWIATGAGSTAASKSAGGRILPPTYPGMQYLVREPLIQRGKKYNIIRGILNKTESITLSPTSRQTAVFIDGNHIEIPVEYGESVTVSARGRPLKMVL